MALNFKKYKIYIISGLLLINCRISNAEFKEAWEEVNDIIKEKYIDQVNEKKITRGAISGAIGSLDPHSTYFDPEEYQEFKNNTQGKFCGIGIEAIKNANESDINVMSVLYNSPAMREGVENGDIITHVNNESLTGMSLYNATRKIRGECGTAFKMTIYRPKTRETRTFTIKRMEVKIDSVKYKMLENKIGLIEVRVFNNTTYDAFLNATNSLGKVNGLIIDLRSNPGGLLESAVNISNLFLSEGQLITAVRGKNNAKIYDYIATNKTPSIQKNIPIVVLTNNGSASASEVLAACLKEHSVATIIGEKSFGKASVQELMELSAIKGAAIKITVAKYYTPKGNMIHGVGIQPDIKVQDIRNQEKDNILAEAIKFIDGNKQR